MMKGYCKDNSLWELFVFAVCLKLNSGSSGVHVNDIMTIRKLIACSNSKAKRLIEGAKNCPELFYYNDKKKFLVARSFTRGKLRRSVNYSGYTRYVAYSAYCYKHVFEPGKPISHNKLSQLLRDKLLLSPIVSKERKNDFIKVDNHSTRSDRATALSVKKLSAFTGQHHTSVSRRLHRLEKNNIIKTQRHEIIKLADYYTGELLTDNSSYLDRRPFLRFGCWCIKDANEYHPQNIRSNEFCNVIFNHVKRQKKNYSKREIALSHFDN